MRSLILSTTLLAGCFYTDQINQRPGIAIEQTSGDEVYRESMVTLRAKAVDPENDVVFFTWRAYACIAVADSEPSCDPEPFDTNVTNDATPGESDTMWSFMVPKVLADQTTPTQVVRVVLEAQDDFGAVARPSQTLLIPIANHAPDLTLSMSGRYGYVTDTPIDLFAKVGDVDDGVNGVKPLTWTVYTPMNQPAYTLTDIDVPDDDPTHFLQYGKRFTPKGVGRWEVQVTATDVLDKATMKSLIIDVVPDGAPCLAQWAPITAPAGNTLPLTEPTLFRINVVTDDLDPFPTIPGDTQLGTTTFSWSIKQPGSASRDPLAVTSNQASLDPANYQPGDIIELRVEIEDRNATPVNCADTSQTCSVISNNQCIQRLTWRVEVR